MVKKNKIDPITFQVINSYCESITREMGNIMMRTAYSPIFFEGLDFACEIMDPWGGMIGMDRNAPCFSAAMALTSQWAVLKIGYENLHPGDVILSNDPYMGGTHAADVLVIKPVFYGERRVAIVSTIGHHLDVGGYKPVFTIDANELYQEGIIIPPVKWYRNGIEDTDITEIFLQNIRMPDYQIGDFQAQLASLEIGEKRIQTLCDKYGPGTVVDAFEAIKDYSEKRIRNEIKSMSDGVYDFENFIDNDGVKDEPIRIRVTVKVEGSNITFDFTGTSNQVDGAVNAPYGVTASSVSNALLQVTDPDIPINHGCNRPIKIIAPRGTLVNPLFPAAVNVGNDTTTLSIMETILGAFAQIVPEKVTAANYGSVPEFGGSGFDNERQQPFMWIMWPVGGWGGRKNMDGWDAIFSQQANCMDQSAEITETQYPLLMESVRLNVEGGTGAGKFRGGFGVIKEVTMLDDTYIFAAVDRHDIGPFGLFGGLPSKSNNIMIRKKGEREYRQVSEFTGQALETKGNLQLEKGDTVILMQAGGGGYGDPFQRDVALVIKDVENGFISKEEALENYGVVLLKKNGQLKADTEKTKKLRKKGLNKKINTIKGVVNVDEGYLKASDKLKDIKYINRSPETERILASKEKISIDFCKKKCKKEGKELRCPWYNEVALNFWPLHRIEAWTQYNCPLQKDGIVKLI